MSALTSSIVAGFDAERSRAASTFNSAYQTLGSALTQSPVIIVLDNQTTVDVEFSIDGTTTWKTFSTSEALVLDMRANHGKAFDFTLPIGTQLYVRGTGGTGSFRASIIYAR